MIERDYISDWAVSGHGWSTVAPVIAPTPAMDRFAKLVSIARQRASMRSLPNFDSKLAREARQSDAQALWMAARQHALNISTWARVAEPTLQTLAHNLLANLVRVVELVRAAASMSAPHSSGSPASPTVLLIKPLVMAACAPPARPLLHVNEGLIAA